MLRRYGLYTGLACLLCAPAIFAQSDSRPTQKTTANKRITAANAEQNKTAALPDVLVTGPSRLSASGHPGKTPLLTDTTARKTFKDLQIDDLDDYTKRIDAGVSVNDQNNSVEIRGLDRNRVQTRIDGIRVPWLDDGARGVQGGMSNNYDFDSLGRIDVVKSSDASAFGTGALGGILDLRTLDPEDLIKGDEQLGGLTKSSYNGADSSWQFNQALAGRYKDTWLLIQGGYKSGNQLGNKGTNNGIGDVRTRPDPANYNQKNYLIKLHQYLADNHELSLTGERFTYDESTDSRTQADGQSYSDYHIRNQNKRRRASLGYDYRPDDTDGLIRGGHLVGYWQRVSMADDSRGDRLDAPLGYYRRDSSLKEKSYGINGYLKMGFDTPFFGQNLSHEASTGGEVAGQKTSQYAAGEDSCTPGDVSCTFLHTNQSEMPDVQGVRVGAFGQDRIGFLDDQVHLTLGLRYDWYKRSPNKTDSYAQNAAYEGLPNSTSDWKLSPKVLAEWQIVPEATVYFQWAQSFRAPSATELYMTYGGDGTYLQKGNPDLKPETSNSFEVGSELGDDQLGGRLSLYNNYYKNFIDSISVSKEQAGVSGHYPFGITAYENRNHVHIYGAELNGHWEFLEHWRLWGSVAYAVGKDTDTHEHLNSIPPLRGILGLGYKTETYGANFSMAAAGKRHRVENPDSDINKTPAYAVFDVSAWWQPEMLHGVRFQAGVFNLTDKRYYTTMDVADNSTQPQQYYSQPGRHAKFALRYEF